MAQIEQRDREAASDAAEASRILNELSSFGPVLAVKLYRLTLDPAPGIPSLPCLDHEAMLHEGIPPHAAAYLQDATSGDIHEVVIIPARRRVEVDTVSTFGEHSEESRARLVAHIQQRLPGLRVTVKGPSWWRGERRVAKACRAQVSLRDGLKNSATTGNELRFRYDASDRLIGIDDDLGKLHRLIYGDGGRLTRLIDATGREWIYDYTPEGLLESVTTPALTVGERTYPAGLTTSYDYGAVPSSSDLATRLMSRDNLLSLRVPNVASGELPGLEALGIRAAALEAVAPSYLSADQGPRRLDHWRKLRQAR